MKDGGAEAGQHDHTGGENVGRRAVGCQFMFQTLLQIVRMAYPQNLSQLPRLRSAIFRMQGAEGCVILRNIYIYTA